MRADIAKLSFAFGFALLACDAEEVTNAGSASHAGTAGAGATTSSTAGGSSVAGAARGGNAAGGATANGGASNGGTTVSVAGRPNVNAGCPTWPASELFPTIGPFFYGPNPGPCSMTTGTEVWNYTYDAAGQLTQQAMPGDGTVITFVYEQGRLVRETSTSSAGSSGDTTYTYSGNSVTYTTTSSSGSVSSYTYTLDPQGYPTYTVVANASATSTNPAFYAYVYENCRLVRRLGFNASNIEMPQFAVQYAYDEAGRLTHRTSASRDEVYDYSCW